VPLATLTTVLGDTLPERGARMGGERMDGLRALRPACPVVKQVRGRGLLTGVERSTPAAPIVDACREAGLLVLSAGEKVVRLVPPLIVESADVRRALGILNTVL